MKCCSCCVLLSFVTFALSKCCSTLLLVAKSCMTPLAQTVLFVLQQQLLVLISILLFFLPPLWDLAGLLSNIPFFFLLFLSNLYIFPSLPLLFSQAISGTWWVQMSTGCPHLSDKCMEVWTSSVSFSSTSQHQSRNLRVEVFCSFPAALVRFQHLRNKRCNTKKKTKGDRFQF